jgi:hypothetical protein
VNLLAATCTVDNKPIISNQRLITELLFSSSVSGSDSPDRLTIPIRISGGDSIVPIAIADSAFAESAPARAPASVVRMGGARPSLPRLPLSRVSSQHKVGPSPYTSVSSDVAVCVMDCVIEWVWLYVCN